MFSNEDITEWIQFSINIFSTAVSFFYNFGLFVVLYNMVDVREDEARELELMLNYPLRRNLKFRQVKFSQV